MTERLTIDEAQGFLDANPEVQWVDAFLFDMNGIPRGKRVRRSDLLDVARNGLMMPSSVFIMDPLGNCVEETGKLWETGDPDLKCHLLSKTLVPIPVGDGRHAQAVLVVDAREELDPRAVLGAQVERFAGAGRTPVAAVELEFYVTRKSKNGAFALNTPEGLSDDPGRPLTFGFEELDALSPFIDDIYRVCEVQDLPVDAVTVAQVERHKRRLAARSLDLVVEVLEPADGASHGDDVGTAARGGERTRSPSPPGCGTCRPTRRLSGSPCPVPIPASWPASTPTG